MGEHIEHLDVHLAATSVRRHLRKTDAGIEDVDEHLRKVLTVPEMHQLKVARDTLKMNPAMRGVMGGPSAAEAAEIVRKLEAKGKQHVPSSQKPTGSTTPRRGGAPKAKDLGYTEGKQVSAADLKPGDIILPVGGGNRAAKVTKVHEWKAHKDAAPMDWVDYEFIGTQGKPGDRDFGNSTYIRDDRHKVQMLDPPKGKEASSAFYRPEDWPEAKGKAPKRASAETVAARRREGPKAIGYAGPKRSAAETKAILQAQKEGKPGSSGIKPATPKKKTNKSEMGDTPPGRQQKQAEQGRLTPSGHRPLNNIASDIYDDWGKQKGGINFAAKPYAEALRDLSDINDQYMSDSASTIVNYFLANASQWRGPKAKEVKAELKAILKKNR